MIKFRCPQCTQKIAVNNDAAGAVFACPTCAAYVTVPAETDAEFRLPPVLTGAPVVPSPASVRVAPADILATDERFLHRARLLRDAVLRAVLGQWRHLLDSQQAGADQLMQLERRLTLLQQQYATRLHDHQARVAELESAMAIRSEQTRRLQQENARLTRELARARSSSPVGVPLSAA